MHKQEMDLRTEPTKTKGLLDAMNCLYTWPLARNKSSITDFSTAVSSSDAWQSTNN